MFFFSPENSGGDRTDRTPSAGSDTGIPKRKVQH